MLGRIKLFFRLPPPGRRIFLKMCLLIPLIETGVRIAGFKRTARTLKYLAGKPAAEPSGVRKIIDLHEYYLRLYARQFPFFGKCLARSLTLWYLLRKTGITTDLRFGMKKENDKLLAHAWLEYDNLPIAGEAETGENYQFFTESILTELR